MWFNINGAKLRLNQVSDKFLQDTLAEIHVMTMANVELKSYIEEELAFRTKFPEYSIKE